MFRDGGQRFAFGDGVLRTIGRGGSRFRGCSFRMRRRASGGRIRRGGGSFGRSRRRWRGSGVFGREALGELSDGQAQSLDLLRLCFYGLLQRVELGAPDRCWFAGRWVFLRGSESGEQEDRRSGRE